MNFNNLMTDGVTISYLLIQSLLIFASIMQAKKGYFKTSISMMIMIILYSCWNLNMFYVRK